MADSTSSRPESTLQGNRSAAEGGSPNPGLVICAITGHGTTSGAKNPGIAPIPDTVPDGLIGHRWPSPELVSAAAASFTRTLPAWDGSEGPRARIEVGPGIVRVARRDLNRAEKTAERATARRLRENPAERDDDDTPRRGEVLEWSAKSRARMTATIASLDLREFTVTREGIPAMVTLTLPGDWLAVAPTAASYVALVKTFRKRYERAWGRPLRALWKREFQRRGAPHTHFFMVVPFGQVNGETFTQWLSRTWAEVVAHPDPEQRAAHLLAGTGVDIAEGLRSTDPRRIAVYFTKHSSANFGDKEYQHVVPAEWAGSSAGRFWGYWGLQPATAYVEVPMDDSIAVARVMRRWARAQGTTRAARVWRNGRWRSVRRRVHRMPSTSGFLCVNDGPAFAWQLARFLDLRGGES